MGETILYLSLIILCGIASMGLSYYRCFFTNQKGDRVSLQIIQSMNMKRIFLLYPISLYKLFSKGNKNSDLQSIVEGNNQNIIPFSPFLNEYPFESSFRMSTSSRYLFVLLTISFATLKSYARSQNLGSTFKKSVAERRRIFSIFISFYRITIVLPLFYYLRIIMALIKPRSNIVTL